MGSKRLAGRRLLTRQLLLMLLMPFIVMSSSYAVFSQQLTVNGGSTSVAYVSNNYTTATYTKSVAGSGPYTYTYNMTVKNNGATSITAWRVTFNVPPSMTALTCPSSVICTQNATTVTIQNGAGNGTVATLGSTSFTFSFTTTAVNYVLQNMNISATYATTFQTIVGLSVTASIGAKSGGTFPLNITITNNSGQSISGWRVVIPTNRACTLLTGLPASVTYTCSATNITLTANTMIIANGASYSFPTAPRISSSGTISVKGTATVQGKG